MSELTTNEAPDTAQYPKTLLVTPDMAGNFLAECQFPRQRKLHTEWVVELVHIIKEDRWATTTITFAYCEEDRHLYLVDGYHRLSAIYTSGLSAPLVVHVEIVETLEDVATLYSRLDRGIPRNVSDGLRAMDYSTQTGLPLTALRAGVAAVSVIRAEFRFNAVLSKTRSYDERFSILEEWIDEIRDYTSVVGRTANTRNISRRLHTSPIMAVGLVLMRHQPVKAKEFFGSVASLVGLQPNTGPHTFATKVLHAEDVWVRKHGVALVSRWAALCWNAFMENRELSMLRVNDPTRPMILLGTPYTEHRAKR